MKRYATLKVRDSHGNLVDVVLENSSGNTGSNSGNSTNGTNDYNSLKNIPSLDGKKLQGEMTTEQLGLASKSDWGNLDTILDSINGDGTSQINQILDEINGEVI